MSKNFQGALPMVDDISNNTSTQSYRSRRSKHTRRDVFENLEFHPELYTLFLIIPGSSYSHIRLPLRSRIYFGKVEKGDR
jgi:hypothetical protein